MWQNRCSATIGRVANGVVSTGAIAQIQRSSHGLTMDELGPIKLAVVAAALARERPDIDTALRARHAARGASAEAGERQRGSSEPLGVAGARVARACSDCLDARCPISPVLRERNRRHIARHTKAMRRIRARWRLIGWAALAVFVFVAALVIMELIERL